MLKTVLLVLFCLLATDITVNDAGATRYVVAGVGHGLGSLSRLGSSVMGGAEQ